MDVSPDYLFHTIVSIFSNREDHLEKNMKISHTANPRSVIHAVRKDVLNINSQENSEVDTCSIASEVSTWIEIIQQHYGRHDV